VQASQNQIGNIGDRVLLYCYHYDPRTGKYGAIISNILKLSGLATMLILGTFMFIMFRADRRSDNGSGRRVAHDGLGRVK
jgi:protein SCO1/2